MIRQANVYDRCGCGHSRRAHRYGRNCSAPSQSPTPGVPSLRYRCSCTAFVLRPPVWRVEKERPEASRDWNILAWFARSAVGAGNWLVVDPDPRNRSVAARCPSQAMAFRVAWALAERDAGVEDSMGRHPAGRGLSPAAREAMLDWANPFRPMSPTPQQIVDDARAKLRVMPYAPNPLLDNDAIVPGGGGYIPQHYLPPDLGPLPGPSYGGSMHYVTRDSEATIADKADHYRER